MVDHNEDTGDLDRSSELSRAKEDIPKVRGQGVCDARAWDWERDNVGKTETCEYI